MYTTQETTAHFQGDLYSVQYSYHGLRIDIGLRLGEEPENVPQLASIDYIPSHLGQKIILQTVGTRTGYFKPIGRLRNFYNG
jgi:hypothetical protein